MPVVAVSNTSAALSGKTIVLAEADQTITGLQSFNRTTNAPFAVNPGAGVVANLHADTAQFAVNADTLDGLDSSAFVKTTDPRVFSLVGADNGIINSNVGNTALSVMNIGNMTLRDRVVIAVNLIRVGGSGAMSVDIFFADNAGGGAFGTLLLTGANGLGDIASSGVMQCTIDIRAASLGGSGYFLQALAYGAVFIGYTQALGKAFGAALPVNFFTITGGVPAMVLRVPSGTLDAPVQWAWSAHMLKGQ